MTPPVVLLHGLGANRDAWQRFVRLLPDEWDKRPIDMLGHGEAPKPEHGYGLADYAHHVASLLDQPVALVGHSLGASTAVATAALHPELVERIVLLDPPMVEGTISFKNGGRTQQMIEGKLHGDVGETVRRLFPEFSAPLQNWTIATWEQMAPGVVRELDHDWTSFAASVNQPVTVIHGDVEAGGYGPGASDYFADATEVRIPGAGHYLHATHARETAGAVTDALSTRAT